MSKKMTIEISCLNNTLDLELPYFYKVNDDFFGLLPLLEYGKIRTISIFEKSISWEDINNIKESTANDLINIFLKINGYSKISEQQFVAKLLKTPLKNVDL
jgi:hypothetical protein